MFRRLHLWSLALSIVALSFTALWTAAPSSRFLNPIEFYYDAATDDLVMVRDTPYGTVWATVWLEIVRTDDNRNCPMPKSRYIPFEDVPNDTGRISLASDRYLWARPCTAPGLPYVMHIRWRVWLGEGTRWPFPIPLPARYRAIPVTPWLNG